MSPRNASKRLCSCLRSFRSTGPTDSLHYDFRLELDGTMKSWAVPKGPSLDTKDKRLAVQVEDHPIAYSRFEGTIAVGQDGAGRVIIWDKGTWTPLGRDPHKDYLVGNLKFTLHDHKLGGNWVLVRVGADRVGDKQPPWLLIKEKDGFTRSAQEFNVVEALPDSVANSKSVTSAAHGMAMAAQAATIVALKVKGTAKPSSSAPVAALPLELKPQLAVLVDRAPQDAAQWVYEIKYDGYRLLTRVDEGGTVQMFTRTGKDWSHKLAALLNEVMRLRLPSGWYDGEIVVNDAQTGRPDFGALQDSMDASGSGDIVLYLFDLPYFDGQDLRQQPLYVRRALLEKCLQTAPYSSRIRFSLAFDADVDSLISSACKLGLEGIVGKRKYAPYVSRRSADWIKLKCHQRQEFVIGGYTEPQGTREQLGALLLGIYDASGGLHYAGKVGTGFNTKALRDVAAKLKPLAARKCPFVDPANIEGQAYWVKPILISAAQWNVVEFHTANASKRSLSSPDRMVFDLDPGDGVQWVQIREAAALVHAFLGQLGLQSFLKTSGGKGLHLVVPLRRVHDWATVKGFSQAIVQHVSAQIPTRFVAKSGTRNGVGKIFIDYLRNSDCATTVSAWSARARAGMGISVPVHWDELDQLRCADHWTVLTVAERLSVGNTPWDGYAKAARSLTAAIQKLGYKPAG
jgi:DNA ligase D-like protein (predicted ligase)/DNA ligase D-like protein (predicted 3'-phosphoesterase)